MAGNPPAVILGGSANAVSVARSLARASVRVYALGTGGHDAVRHSRACSVYVPALGGDRLQRDWLAWLESAPRALAGAVLLPCNDEGLELLARNRAHLLELGYRPFEASDEVALAMLDKSDTYRLARRVGVRAPATVDIRTPDDLDRAAAELGFPCALKPLHSHLNARHRRRPKAVVVENLAELRQAHVDFAALGVDVLATEIVPGRDDSFASYYTYIAADGEPLLHFTKRKLRQYPTGFGLGCYEATTHDREVAEAGWRFLRGIGLRGLAAVEFKRDARDRQLTLIECNHRFTASSELVRLAGIDLALLTYNRILGRPGPDVGSYRAGVHFWRPIEDARSFLSSRGSEQLTGREWVRSLMRRQHFPVFRLSDPKPTVVNLSRTSRLAMLSGARMLRRLGTGEAAERVTGGVAVAGAKAHSVTYEPEPAGEERWAAGTDDVTDDVTDPLTNGRLVELRA